MKKKADVLSAVQEILLTFANIFVFANSASNYNVTIKIKRLKMIDGLISPAL